METVVAPIEMPFVVSADSTSRRASVNDTLIVVKITEKMTRVNVKSSVETRTGRFSLT